MDTNEVVNTILALPRDIKIYAYNGHGLDMCDDKGEAIIRQVPKGCIYVTIEECYDVGYFMKDRQMNFHSSDIRTKCIFKYPYLFLNELDKILLPRKNVQHRTTHFISKIHLPGENYAVSHLFPFSYWYDNQSRPGFAISGLVEKGQMEAHPPNEYPFGTYLNVVDRRVSPLPPVNKKDIVQYFQASAYPTPAQVKRVVDSILTFPANGIYQPLKIQDGALLCYEIETKLEEELGYFKGVSDEDGPDAFISNTYMMEKFPGIHYNFVCRSMEEDCDKRRTAGPRPRRRRNSIAENESRRSLLESSGIQERIMNHILTDPALDEETRKIIRGARSV